MPFLLALVLSVLPAFLFRPSRCGITLVLAVLVRLAHQLLLVPLHVDHAVEAGVLGDLGREVPARGVELLRRLERQVGVPARHLADARVAVQGVHHLAQQTALARGVTGDVLDLHAIEGVAEGGVHGDRHGSLHVDESCDIAALNPRFMGLGLASLEAVPIGRGEIGEGNRTHPVRTVRSDARLSFSSN